MTELSELKITIREEGEFVVAEMELMGAGLDTIKMGKISTRLIEICPEARELFDDLMFKAATALVNEFQEGHQKHEVTH